MPRSQAYLAILVVLWVSWVSLSSGCANIVPPQGGPKDTLPPVLISVRPADSSLNFDSRTIVFNFDEYVELNQVQQNLIVSPNPTIAPNVDARLRTVTVRLRDSLEPNTTYYFNFGNAIRDINEGNVFPGFSYIFSTGPDIDTLSFSGKVVLAETGTLDTTLMVMLHRNGDDSALINERPRYVTRQDREGVFRFRYLSPGTYYLYAVKDESRQGRYFGGPQLFAFADDPVVIGENPEPVTLYAFEEEKETPATPTLGLNRGGGGRADERRLRISTNLSSNLQDLLDELTLTFEQPLVRFDSSLLTLHIDSTFRKLSGYRWALDSTRTKITLEGLTWQPGTQYHIIADREFAEDSSGRKLLKTDTISFNTKNLGDYGSLRIRFRNIAQSANPVVQFVQNGRVVNSAPLNGEYFESPIFLPGEYELRILYDRNGNGLWDPGNFFDGRIQPEIVAPIERKITIRNNWDNEFEINLN